MIQLKSFKYRIYPDEHQKHILLRWQNQLNSLWNKSHKQRLKGLEEDSKVYYKFHSKKNPELSQANLLTKWSKENKHLARVPRASRTETLKVLNTAWQDCFKKTKGKPKLKKFGKNHKIYIPYPMTDFIIEKFLCKGIRDPKWNSNNLLESWSNFSSKEIKRGRRDFRITFGSKNSNSTYKDLGSFKIVIDRSFMGKIKQWNIVRDNDEWYAIVLCEQESKQNYSYNISLPEIGIDRGVKYAIATSNNKLVKNPKFLDSCKKKINHLSRNLQRKKKRSKNREKARLLLAKEYMYLRRCRKHFMEVQSKRFSDHKVVVLEDLKINNMTKSASGTMDNPGTNVSQKRGLNRSILDVGWGIFDIRLGQKLESKGNKLIKIPPQYTSQTCTKCGHVDSHNRNKQKFKCISCGYIGHADIIAAKNILQKGLYSLK